MITIAWYNLVAIIVGIVLYFWASSFDDDGFLAGIGGVCAIILAIIFYAIWGGIFWW